jgi:hypothetical protein
MARNARRRSREGIMYITVEVKFGDYVDAERVMRRCESRCRRNDFVR